MHLSKSLLSVLAAAFFASTTAGCFGAGPGARVALHTATLIAGIELQEKWDAEAAARKPVYVYEPGDFDPVTSPEDLEHVEQTKAAAPAFDMAAARTALHDVDLGPCATGQASYGHGVVTFAPSGHITKVVIDGPDGLASTTAKCIGDRVGTARTTAFSGAEVTTGMTFYMPATTPATAKNETSTATEQQSP
jgi:hypothetical protein